MPSPIASRLLPLLAAGLLAAPAARAQDVYVYALNEEGRVSVNGVVVDNLQGGFDLDSFDDLDDIDDFEEIWQAIAVDGPDRYALRWDGRMSRNGMKLDQLAFDDIFDEVWIDLGVVGGEPVALRTDGRVNRDGELVVEHNDGDFYFVRVLVDGSDYWVLRSDGRVFRNTEATAVFAFDAGGEDGEDFERHWVDMAIDPTDGQLYALRRDGKVIRGDPSEGEIDPGTLVASLPFGSTVDLGTVYYDLEFLDDGTWLALRGSGRLFDETNVINPIEDYPGDPDDDIDEITVRLLSLGDDWLVMRRDGKVYLGSGDGSAYINLPKNGYTDIAVSDTLPDLSTIKNAKPLPARYKATAVAGEAIRVPLLVVDQDMPADGLEVGVDESSVPEGAVWNAEDDTLDWAEPVVGNFKVKLEVTDGEATVKATLSIKVRAADDDESKNRKPQGPKINKLVALKGVPFELPLIVVDEDGDPLTITIDEEAYPFDAGATWDEKTATFSWTPTADDLGKVKLAFVASDGTVERKLKVKLKVENTLLAP